MGKQKDLDLIQLPNEIGGQGILKIFSLTKSLHPPPPPSFLCILFIVLLLLCVWMFVCCCFCLFLFFSYKLVCDFGPQK